VPVSQALCRSAPLCAIQFFAIHHIHLPLGFQKFSSSSQHTLLLPSNPINNYHNYILSITTTTPNQLHQLVFAGTDDFYFSNTHALNF
jgi:hypothetical protein